MQITCSLPHFYGWISYGYLESRQTSMVGGRMTTFPRYTDQTHTIAVTGDVDLGKQWSVSSRLVYGSGYPYTPSHAVLNSAKGIWEWITDTTPNSAYLPSYARVDLKIAKEFQLFGSAVSAFFDVSNLFNAVNVQAVRYRFDSKGQPYSEFIKLWPRLPTVGLAVRF